MGGSSKERVQHALAASAGSCRGDGYVTGQIGLGTDLGHALDHCRLVHRARRGGKRRSPSRPGAGPGANWPTVSLGAGPGANWPTVSLGAGPANWPTVSGLNEKVSRVRGQ